MTQQHYIFFSCKFEVYSELSWKGYGQLIKTWPKTHVVWDAKQVHVFLIAEW